MLAMDSHIVRGKSSDTWDPGFIDFSLGSKFGSSLPMYTVLNFFSWLHINIALHSTSKSPSTVNVHEGTITALQTELRAQVG